MRKKISKVLMVWPWKLCLVLALFVFIFTITIMVPSGKYFVNQVSDTGELHMTDGRKVTLSGVRISPEGTDDHQAAIFLLTEMTKNVPVWLESKGDAYKVWIGCRNFLFWNNCQKGVTLNELLIKAGLAVQI